MITVADLQEFMLANGIYALEIKTPRAEAYHYEARDGYQVGIKHNDFIVDYRRGDPADTLEAAVHAVSA